MNTKSIFYIVISTGQTTGACIRGYHQDFESAREQAVELSMHISRRSYIQAVHVSHDSPHRIDNVMWNLYKGYMTQSRQNSPLYDGYVPEYARV